MGKIVIPIKVKGGAGSGNWGHAGRPGLVGGSASIGAGVPSGKLTQTEINSILHDHAAWLKNHKDGKQANLAGADLTGINLGGADLGSANLVNADLTGTSLAYTNLDGADLTGANLTGVNLYNANLMSANLTGANLTGANLTGVYLVNTKLTGANLAGADLYNANLTGANMEGVKLTSTTTLPDLTLTPDLLASTKLPGWQNTLNAVNHLNEGGLSWHDASNRERGDVKADIASTLASATGIDDFVVDDIIGGWSTTSNKTSAASYVQQAAAQELGVELSAWQQKMAATHTPPPQLTMNTHRSLIRAMYTHTQQALKDAGFKPDDTITMYRGLRFPTADWKPGDIMNYQGNAIESWSISRDAATEFATEPGKGMVTMAVPVRDIVSSARTGFGCLTEGEFVIMGTMPDMQASVESYIMPRW